MLAEDERLVERDGALTAELDSLPVPETIQAVLAAGSTGSPTTSATSCSAPP